MNVDTHPAGKARKGDYMVGRPRVTDALGHALRGVFGDTPMPADLAALLNRLDRVAH